MIRQTENTSPYPLPYLPNNLQNIALSFSGGGFRAAAFSLGCFSYLENSHFGEAKLSGMVRFISSASGGSFPCLAITQAQRQGLGFGEAYRKLFAALDGDRLLQRVHEILTDNNIWEDSRPTKDRNFINAFAIAYDELVFNGDEFGVLWKDAAEGTVNEICVNATDFTHGQQFRFQHDGTKEYRGVFGNKYLSINSESQEQDEDVRREKKAAHWKTIKQIKLGDILAASSCFPGGFEPMMYPNDFAWRNKEAGQALTPQKLLAAIESDDRFINKKNNAGGEDKPIAAYGLMDGGIVDNQGIGAFVLAENRLQNKQAAAAKAKLESELNIKLKQPELANVDKEAIKAQYKEKKAKVSGYGYDLFAACDVSSNYTNQYNYPQQNKSNWLLKPSLLGYIGLVFLLFVVGIVSVVSGIFPALGYLLLGAFGLPIIGIVLLLAWLVIKKTPKMFSKNRAVRSNQMQLFGKHLWVFLNLPLSRVLNMLMARASSVVNLAVVLFLKKIRQDAYSTHMGSSLSRSGVASLVQKAVDRNLLSMQDNAGWQQLLLEQKKWDNNTINPTVYMLSAKNAEQLETDIKGDTWYRNAPVVSVGGSQKLLFEVLQPSDAVIQVANMGTDMPTTLWFDGNQEQQNMRAALIAAGQFSMCHSLLRFAYRFSNHSEEWVQWQKELLGHWLQFKQNPYWLYNKMGHDMAAQGKPIQGFVPAK
jgi:predicted acylesterase/phospholipase RssA